MESQRTNELFRSVETRFHAVDDKVDSLEKRVDELRQDIRDLRNDAKWIIGLIVISILVPILLLLLGQRP